METTLIQIKSRSDNLKMKSHKLKKKCIIKNKQRSKNRKNTHIVIVKSHTDYRKIYFLVTKYINMNL